MTDKLKRPKKKDYKNRTIDYISDLNGYVQALETELKETEDKCEFISQDLNNVTAENEQLKEFNDEVKWILGRPNFWCGSISRLLRKRGYKIKTKSEDEQAYVIHMMLLSYWKHGDKWREIFESELNPINHD